MYGYERLCMTMYDCKMLEWTKTKFEWWKSWGCETSKTLRCNGMDLRKYERNEVTFAKPNRLKNSSIPYMQRKTRLCASKLLFFHFIVKPHHCVINLSLSLILLYSCMNHPDINSYNPIWKRYENKLFRLFKIRIQFPEKNNLFRLCLRPIGVLESTIVYIKCWVGRSSQRCEGLQRERWGICILVQRSEGEVKIA